MMTIFLVIIFFFIKTTIFLWSPYTPKNTKEIFSLFIRVTHIITIKETEKGIGIRKISNRFDGGHDAATGGDAVPLLFPWRFAFSFLYCDDDPKKMFRIFRSILSQFYTLVSPLIRYFVFFLLFPSILFYNFVQIVDFMYHLFHPEK